VRHTKNWIKPSQPTAEHRGRKPAQIPLCSAALFGEVDLYQVTHHGGNINNDFQPADAGGRIEPGVERQRNPRYDQDLSHKPAERATAIGLNDDEMAHDNKLPPAPRA